MVAPTTLLPNNTTTEPFDAPKQSDDRAPGAFDPAAYAAAVAYLGHTGGAPPAFTPNGHGLIACDPEAASRAGAKAWTQINETAPGFPRKKPSNADIAVIHTITWEYEYPPTRHAPMRCAVRCGHD